MPTSPLPEIQRINAFALGASLIVPDCKIDLKWASLVSDRDYLEKWNEQGINVYSDVNFYNSTGIASRSEFISLWTEKQYMGTPYYNWGRYYDQIVRSILSGMWDAKAIIGAHSTMNYWFGLNTGVVDIRLGKNVPYQTKKLLELFKSGIISGGDNSFLRRDTFSKRNHTKAPYQRKHRLFHLLLLHSHRKILS